MTDPLAVVIAAAVTGLFGLLSVIATQILAKKKTAQIEPRELSPREEAEQILKGLPIASIDLTAAILRELREYNVTTRDSFRDVKQDLQELKDAIRSSKF